MIGPATSSWRDRRGQWPLRGTGSRCRPLKWTGSKLGVGADSAQRHKFLQPTLAPDFYELSAHHQVVVEKLSWIVLVRADPSDPCGQRDDHIGGSITIQLLHRVHVNEIVVFTPGDNDVLAAVRAELFHDERSKKAGSACHDHTLLYPK